MEKTKLLYCENPVLYHRTLVGGLAHGEKVGANNGLRPVRTQDGAGTYRSVSFCVVANGQSVGIDIWFHESISDTEAELWAGGLFHLPDLRRNEKTVEAMSRG